jgi:prevent-host-death family protein
MNVAISEAKAHLTDLVRRAEAGEDVVLTRHGHPAVRLVPVKRKPTEEEKRELLRRLSGVAKGMPEWEGVTAATAADFLYDDETGLPA